jgi:protease-4
MSEMVPVTPPPEPRQKSRAGTFFIGAFSGCLIGLFVFGMIAAFIASMRDGGTTELGINKVAVIPIEGEIVEARDALEALHRHADSATVKAIVMRINSPGGAVAPSQEIYEEIRNVRAKTGKPIVASLDNVAASGGYYIASACDEIVANPGSITGSIGVILQWMEIKDLVAWAKMKPETITSGSMKDAGSPYRDITDSERAYLQRITAQLHQQFIRAVFDGRKGKIKQDELTRIADGRVFTGEEALALKLVDRLGNLHDAVNVAGRMAGIRGTPSMLYPRKKRTTLFDLLLSDSNENRTLVDRVVNRRAAFLYRW